MICPTDIWLDATLSHRVAEGTPDAYLIKRKGDRMSGLDAARFGLTVEHTDPMTRPVAVDTMNTVRTAAMPSPIVAGSPRRKRR